jgi:CHAT domain-containing protein
MQNLTSAEDEVNFISNLFNSKEVFLENNATENKVKAECSRFDIIHFACHGHFDLDNPTHSALFLAKDATDDGQLFVDEIFGLKLSQTQLVVLSACETGLSKIVQGDELIGLTRAFIYAGTPALVASLWSVNDQSTGILIKNFYSHFKADNKSGSLREAQLFLKSQKQFTHPYYWSCFEMVGDWK